MEDATPIHTCTVDWEFLPLIFFLLAALVAKIKHAKIFLCVYRAFNFSPWRKLNA